MIRWDLGVELRSSAPCVGPFLDRRPFVRFHFRSEMILVIQRALCMLFPVSVKRKEPNENIPHRSVSSCSKFSHWIYDVPSPPPALTFHAPQIATRGNTVTFWLVNDWFWERMTEWVEHWFVTQPYNYTTHPRWETLTNTLPFQPGFRKLLPKCPRPTLILEINTALNVLFILQPK